MGLDFNKGLMEYGKKFNTFNNLKLKFGNILKLNNNFINKFELITSFQTLSFLEDYEKASLQMIKLKPNYICISSLFWEGLIDFKMFDSSST